MTDELLISYNITDKHYLSAATTFLSISNHALPGNYYMRGGALLVSIIFAQNEILEFFLPVNSTRNTYALLLEVSNNNTDEVNRLLETALVVTANIEISSGILFLQALKINTNWFALLNEACDHKEKFPEFLRFSLQAMLFGIARIVGHGLPCKPMNNYVIATTKKAFKDQFFNNTIYHPGNFMVLSTGGFNAETYSNDLSTALGTHLSIFQNLCFYSSSVVSLTSFGNKVVIVLGIAVADGAFTCGLDFVQERIQYFNEEQGRIFNIVGTQEKHDIESANLLVQSNALGYMQNQWQTNINAGDQVKVQSVVSTNIYESVYEVYTNVVLWSGTPVFVVYLVSKDIIAADQVLGSILSIKKHCCGYLNKIQK